MFSLLSNLACLPEGLLSWRRLASSFRLNREVVGLPTSYSSGQGPESIHRNPSCGAICKIENLPPTAAG